MSHQIFINIPQSATGIPVGLKCNVCHYITALYIIVCESLHCLCGFQNPGMALIRSAYHKHGTIRRSSAIQLKTTETTSVYRSAKACKTHKLSDTNYRFVNTPLHHNLTTINAQVNQKLTIHILYSPYSDHCLLNVLHTIEP